MNRQFTRVGMISRYSIIGIIAVALSSCSTFTPGDESSHASYSASEPFVLGYGVGEEGSFEMFAVNGSIEIIGVEDATTIDIWGERIVSSESKDDARVHIEDIQFNVRHGRYHLTFETAIPADLSGREYEVEYHVRVPMGWDVSLRHDNGRIRTGSISRALCIELSNGDVILDSVHGDVTTRVMNGTITGDVSLTNGESCNLEIANGDIDLFIPGDLSAMLTADVVNGTVDVSELPIHYLNESADEVCGCLGDGEKSVELSAVNGTIRIHCR